MKIALLIISLSTCSWCFSLDLDVNDIVQKTLDSVMRPIPLNGRFNVMDNSRLTLPSMHSLRIEMDGQPPRVSTIILSSNNNKKEIPEDDTRDHRTVPIQANNFHHHSRHHKIPHSKSEPILPNKVLELDNLPFSSRNPLPVMTMILPANHPPPNLLSMIRENLSLPPFHFFRPPIIFNPSRFPPRIPSIHPFSPNRYSLPRAPVVMDHHLPLPKDPLLLRPPPGFFVGAVLPNSSIQFHPIGMIPKSQNLSSADGFLPVSSYASQDPSSSNDYLGQMWPAFQLVAAAQPDHSRIPAFFHPLIMVAPSVPLTSNAVVCPFSVAMLGNPDLPVMRLVEVLDLAQPFPTPFYFHLALIASPENKTDDTRHPDQDLPDNPNIHPRQMGSPTIPTTSTTTMRPMDNTTDSNSLIQPWKLNNNTIALGESIPRSVDVKPFPSKKSWKNRLTSSMDTLSVEHSGSTTSSGILPNWRF